MNTIKLKDFLALEQKHRKSQIWFSGNYDVVNDSGIIVNVTIKQFGFYGQSLYINGGFNVGSSHTINSATGMKRYLSEKINGAA